MLHYYITIISKNRNSIKNFFIFFDRVLNSFNTIKKHLRKKQKQKILTILKSPHVNKTAQEQFEIRLFSSQISIYYSPKSFQFLIFLKKVKVYLFPDVKMKVKFNFNKFLIKNTQFKILNPNKFRLQFFHSKLFNNKILKKIKQSKATQYNKQKKIKLKNLQSLIKVFDTYGNLIKISLDSSVGRAKD